MVGQIALFSNHACALSKAAGVQCWGLNASGQLGNNSISNSNVPVTAMGVPNTLMFLTAGDAHSCVMVQGGLMCWGSNSNGQLGTGSMMTSHVPVNIPGTGNVILVAAGTNHTCVLSGSGPMCWGSNSNGQLGNGNMTDSPTPVSIMNVGGFFATLSAGGVHNCGILTVGGTVECWGGNASGQLGNASTMDSDLPVTLPASLGFAFQVAANTTHPCILNSARAVVCWGSNSNGQLGNNSTMDSHVGVTVVEP
jgi:alpha-tubulin suppressor-like RCC1 family protein